VRQELTNTYKENAPEFVPEQTLYRYFKLLGKGKWVTGKATRRRSAANTPDRTYGGTRRLLPGEEVQVDSTPMDVMVMTSEGPQRPILTIMIDIATRAIISITIRLVAAKGYDHALLLARALTPIGSRPDNTVHRALISARYPEVKLLSAEERDDLKATTPFIFPRRIMMDNGMDFISNTFKSACHIHQVDITQAAIRTPTDKAVVERAFRTINNLFTQYLPGYVGDSPVNRGLDVEKEKLLDVSTLNEMLDDWVTGTYNHRPHGGLIDPFDPTITYSPVEWFNASADFVGGATLPLTQDQFIELLPSTPRKITKKGIHLFNRDYDSIDLHPYRDRKSKNPRLNGGWEVKYNPYDLSSVWVLSPEKNWIECRWRHSAMVAQPHFADIQRNLQKNRADRADVAFDHAAGSGTPMPRGTTDLLDPAFSESEFDWSADDLALVLDNYDPDKE
jgi:putative transposase